MPAAEGPCPREHLQGHVFGIIISVWRCLNWSYLLTPGCVWQWCIPSNGQMMITHGILGVPFKAIPHRYYKMNELLQTARWPLCSFHKIWEAAAELERMDPKRCIALKQPCVAGQCLFGSLIPVCRIPLKTWFSRFLSCTSRSVLHFWYIQILMFGVWIMVLVT